MAAKEWRAEYKREQRNKEVKVEMVVAGEQVKLELKVVQKKAEERRGKQQEKGEEKKRRRH